MSKHVLLKYYVVSVLSLVFASLGCAQDLEPRRWTALPSGTNVIGIGYGHTSGDLFFDPVLDLENASVEMDTVALSYVRGFSIAGQAARFDSLIPWQTARWEGLLSGAPASTERTGMADPRFRLSILLLGTPEPQSQKPKPNTVVGASVAVSVPLGKNNKNRLFNIGKNRYSIRPQIGATHTRGPWTYELTGSSFFFTDNNDFWNGQRLEQKPIYAVQGHVVRTFKPGLWASLSAGYGWGGEAIINGEEKDNEKDEKIENKEIKFKDGVRFISMQPSTLSLDIDFELKYKNQTIGNQKNKVKVFEDDLTDIYNSRTFCLFEDIEMIKKNGLAKGGSLENAIVVKDDQILNEEGLRNDKEFVNHKILDCIGDLYTSGYRIIATIKCSQGGHFLTNQLLRKVFQNKENFSILEIKEKNLPHTLINKNILRSIA